MSSVSTIRFLGTELTEQLVEPVRKPLKDADSRDFAYTGSCQEGIIHHES